MHCLSSLVRSSLSIAKYQVLCSFFFVILDMSFWAKHENLSFLKKGLKVKFKVNGVQVCLKIAPFH